MLNFFGIHIIRRYIFVLFLLTIFCNLNLFSVNQLSYVEYFKKINEAESFIIKQDYQVSLDIYNELFRDYSNISYQDLNNACICALKSEQYQQALFYAKELILHGYDMDDFNKKPFSDDAYSMVFKEPLLLEYSHYREKYLQGFDQDTRGKIFEWYQQDQLAASDFSIQDSVFLQLSEKISNLIEEKGFPSIFLNKDTMNNKLYVMLRHYCGLENREKKFADNDSAEYISRIHKIMNQALHDGWISPLKYIGITTYWEEKNIYGELAVRIDFDNKKITPFYKNVAQEQIKAINFNRNKIGLPLIDQISEDFINDPRYKNYPFEKITEAILNCDTCETMLQYLTILKEPDSKSQEEDNIEKDYFLLSIETANQVRNTYYSKSELFSTINKRIREKKLKQGNNIEK